MHALVSELRHALRRLAARPAFALVAVATLALGSGVTTALFSVARGVLLRPLPFERPGRLVMLWETAPERDVDRRPVAPARFRAWREQASSFTSLAGFEPWVLFNLSGKEAAPETVQAVPVTSGFFSLLGARAALGRTFAPEEIAGDAHVAILSHALWRRRFGGDPAVLGRALSLDGEAYRVVGVMPAGFRVAGILPLGFRPDKDAVLFVPASGIAWEARSYGLFSTLGRLRDGVSPEKAQAEMDAIASRLAREHPDTDTGWGVEVVPLDRQVEGPYRSAILLLLAAAGLVLLVAAVNVAGLLLVRSRERVGEMAVRAALGAPRRRLFAPALAEALLLALAGSLLGLALARWGTAALLALAPAHLPRQGAIGVDGVVLGFALALGCLTALGAALPAGLAAARRGLRPLLEHRAERHDEGRIRALLVVVQVALAVVLAVGAGLLARSVAGLERVDLGFRPQGVLTLRLDLPWARYETGARRGAFVADLLGRLDRLPGVGSAGVVNQIPLGGLSDRFRVWLPGEEYRRHVDVPTAEIRAVAGDYFRALGQPLLAGRLFDRRDRPGAPGVVLVNRTMARSFWPDLAPGEEPLGRRLGLDGPEGELLTVVGVVADVRHFGPDQAPRPEMYVPYHQIAWPSVALVIETTGAPRALLPAVRSAVAALDPELAPYDVATLEERLGASLGRWRFVNALLDLFGAAGLGLAALGLYGLLAYAVASRARELGIRLVLGAEPRALRRRVLLQGLALAALGVAAGTVAAALLAPALGSLLYGVGPADPATFAGAALLLLATAAAAAWPPARRATRVDPAAVLRSE